MHVYRNDLLSLGQWTLKGSASVAVVGTDFVLTCTVPVNNVIPTYVAWTRYTVNSYIATNNCASVTNAWPTYIYSCNNTVFTLTIPGREIDPDSDHDIQWRCGDGGGTNSNPFIVKVMSKLMDLNLYHNTLHKHSSYFHFINS